jgi:hypothetical protein
MVELRVVRRRRDEFGKPVWVFDPQGFELEEFLPKLRFLLRLSLHSLRKLALESSHPPAHFGRQSVEASSLDVRDNAVKLCLDRLRLLPLHLLRALPLINGLPCPFGLFLPFISLLAENLPFGFCEGLSQ